MEKCIYCGNTQSLARDHVVPSSYDRVKRHFDCIAVPACNECNTTLSNKMYLDIRSRARYLYERYLDKHHKLINMPDWDEEELEELDYYLREDLEHTLAKRALTIERIKNCLAAAVLYSEGIDQKIDLVSIKEL